MAVFYEYNREAAVSYARRWALGRNPAYMDYELWGGDCTNFISQCLRSGQIPMDYTGRHVLEKWYWNSDNSRTPTWTSAEPFYKYIIGNNNENTQNFGIYTRIANYNELEIGWNSDNSRTPTWTSAEPFYKYIIGNNNENTQNFGIYTRIANYNELEIGDIVQLVYDNNAYHNMIISEVILEGDYLIDYLICQHTYDLLDYPLSLKEGERRYIKILGYYK